MRWNECRACPDGWHLLTGMVSNLPAMIMIWMARSYSEYDEDSIDLDYQPPDINIGRYSSNEESDASSTDSGTSNNDNDVPSGKINEPIADQDDDVINHQHNNQSTIKSEDNKQGNTGLDGNDNDALFEHTSSHDHEHSADEGNQNPKSIPNDGLQVTGQTAQDNAGEEPMQYVVEQDMD